MLIKNDWFSQLKRDKILFGMFKFAVKVVDTFLKCKM